MQIMTPNHKAIHIKTRTGIAEFATAERANDYLQSRYFQSLLLKFLDYEIQRHIDVKHQNPNINFAIKKVGDLLDNIRKDVQFNFKDAENSHENYLDYNADIFSLLRDVVFDAEVRERLGGLYLKIKKK